MYTAGLDPDIEKLYSSVTFPVPRNTPTISPLIKWNHSETWSVYKWDKDLRTSISHYEIDPGQMASADRDLLGHCIEGRALFPAVGYIVLVWKAFSHIISVGKMSELPIAFENVKFMKATLLSDSGKEPSLKPFLFRNVA